jgi:hypothetical protein
VSLNWVRLDTSIPANFKVLQLVGDKDFRAISVYIFGLAYAGAQGTNGFIPKAALPFLHATPKDATTLVSVALWHKESGGWQINDWAEYQPSSDDAERRAQRAKWMNCRRWHAPECDCSPPPPPDKPGTEWRPKK